MQGIRFTLRPSEFVFASASKTAKEKNISINSELNQVLDTYYKFIEKHPDASVWSQIKGEKGKN